MVVVAAIDRNDRATDILVAADELAGAFDDELHVLHVMTRSEFVDLEMTSVDNTGRPVEMDRVQQFAADFAADAAAEAGLESYEAVGKIGDASRVILDYAADVDARYVVIGGRKRSPAGKVIFGSVTQSTLLNTDRPVVVIMTDQ